MIVFLNVFNFLLLVPAYFYRYSSLCKGSDGAVEPLCWTVFDSFKKLYSYISKNSDNSAYVAYDFQSNFVNAQRHKFYQWPDLIVKSLLSILYPHFVCLSLEWIILFIYFIYLFYLFIYLFYFTLFWLISTCTDKFGCIYIPRTFSL